MDSSDYTRKCTERHPDCPATVDTCCEGVERPVNSKRCKSFERVRGASSSNSCQWLLPKTYWLAPELLHPASNARRSRCSWLHCQHSPCGVCGRRAPPATRSTVRGPIEVFEMARPRSACRFSRALVELVSTSTKCLKSEMKGRSLFHHVSHSTHKSTGKASLSNMKSTFGSSPILCSIVAALWIAPCRAFSPSQRLSSSTTPARTKKLIGVTRETRELLPVESRSVTTHPLDTEDPTVLDLLALQLDDIDHLEREEEYHSKLLELERAMAAAETVYQKLVAGRRFKKPPASSSPPALSRRSRAMDRAQISTTDAGTFVLEFEATGVDASTVFAGAFSLMWFSIILPATWSGAGLFMVPFWGAGAVVAKNAVVDPFVASRLEIGQYAWNHTSKYRKRILKHVDGSTENLREAKVEVGVVAKKRPYFELRLYGERMAARIATSSSKQELEQLADEINQHLMAVREMPDLLIKR